MRPFVFNGHGRLVFPSNFIADLDFSVIETLDHLAAVIRRDFEAKAPTGSEILQRVESGGYASRYELLRDLALNLTWGNRYAMTMYEKRPTRWRDVPRRRDDVFLTLLTPWEDGERKVAAVGRVWEELDPTWDAAAEQRTFDVLFDIFRHKRHHATDIYAIKPTVAEIARDATNLTLCLPGHDPDRPVHSYEEILDCAEAVPELEALHRLALILDNQYPWDRSAARLATVAELDDDDFVVVLVPRNHEVMEFIRRARADVPARTRPAPPASVVRPSAPLSPVVVADHFRVMPQLESLAVVKGECVCTNEDVIRNAAYSWSPMSASEIQSKTGIESRRYTERELEHIGLQAAHDALQGAGRRPEEIGAVLFCSCTSRRLIPSVAAWISGQLGIAQTHGSYDLVSACAGFPYGILEAVRILQEVRRPVLVIFAEKFSDKIGSVRTSRMILADGAAAMVMSPAAEGVASDVEVAQVYASGPVSEVNSIIWPNPEFDNNITIYGPEVRSLVERYLHQMMAELGSLPGPDGGALLDAIDLVVPHQANKTMVIEIAAAAGLAQERLYFNIEQMGNVSAASIPLALFDAVRDGVVDRPMRVFTPAFGAGAVGGYTVMRFDPAIVAPESLQRVEPVTVEQENAAPSVEDVRAAFAG
ncbi:ketoacyl-ACP synthase III [Baekduia soli]|uniref:Ketoacyl-ACP synthase III n=1 Tax=Baekduia soli TaxID=496014 RepID=A0A5B8U041_9ACTN|nr:3-oxoacyl-[acyl-carrier-protein] synthase III C-terminal domain-containing protein [Baekduia soli]QEC46336.1 ketoacyl-ACP synthase III [Baekduia soli]